MLLRRPFKGTALRIKKKVFHVEHTCAEPIAWP